MLILKLGLNKFSSFCQFFACWSTYFCQKRCSGNFSPSGRLTKWAKFAFLSFWSFKTFKISHFCQKRYLSSFSPSGRLTSLNTSKQNCGADINGEAFKCKFFLANAVKHGSWVSYAFLQKPCSFKFFSILQGLTVTITVFYFSTFSSPSPSEVSDMKISRHRHRPYRWRWQSP